MVETCSGKEIHQVLGTFVRQNYVFCVHRPLRKPVGSSTRQSWRSCPLPRTLRDVGNTSMTGWQRRQKVRDFNVVGLEGKDELAEA